MNIERSLQGLEIGRAECRDKREGFHCSYIYSIIEGRVAELLQVRVGVGVLLCTCQDVLWCTCACSSVRIVVY